MKAEFSKAWIKSKKPSKQRKYVANAPLHIKGGFLNSHLSKDLREKYTTRALRVRTDDKVKVMRGTHKGKTGKVEKVSVKDSKVYITGIESIKLDGSKTQYPIKPSNLMIIELNLNDKKRKEKLEVKMRK
jgi:large subunit ribosomal protein L24